MLPTYIRIYIHAYSHTHTKPHTYTHKVLLAVHYSSYLVISSYHKSYQKYFDILLNYKKTRNLLLLKEKSK